MKKVWFIIREYYKEISTSVLAILSTITAFIYRNNPISIWLSLFIILLSLFVLIYLRYRERAFYYVPLSKRDEKDSWIGWGEFNYDRNEKSYVITNSGSGYIYEKCLTWSNYKYEFCFKIQKKCLGVIIRAQNLFNYIMLQIAPEGINPHICIMGGWKRWNHNDESISLTFSEGLSLDRWYKCVICSDKDIVTIKIYNYLTQKIFDREWRIPRGIISVFYENAPDWKEKDNNKIMNYPINLEYGTIGFRNSGDEKALIKEMLVDKLK